MIQESRKRSIARSIIWRLIGILVLAIITWAFTRNLIHTSVITFLHHFIFFWVYYLHERLWQRIKWEGKKRMIGRICLYELILGQGILAIISYTTTGSIEHMTNITLFYIFNKLWLYALYDKIWKKIGWGTSK